MFDGVGTLGINLNTTTAGVWLTGGTITRPVGLQPNNISWTDGGGNLGSGAVQAMTPLVATAAAMAALARR